MQELYLNYLTINNVLPINKDRLFLCYHKLDKDTALEKGNYLKDLFDCAVFYLDYDLFPNPDIDALKKLVEGMYIFIPIVTKNFLGDSLCLDLFKFAKAKSIPVMPLMIDPSLGSEFNRVCGEIHFLQEKYDIVTYVSLEDKIKDFYNNVVGKKFSYEKQIKEAFKYSIFLSYRRCDREKAYPIIAKLHEDEELYDVGAWYDEFLTYGENFANEIIEKIQNSTIVIIFITNNAFEPGNYVKDEEFNKAKKFGKIIIPVYSEEFDLDEFHKCFPGLMDPISVDEMPNEIKKNIVVTRNADAMHDFFVGVGYLYGMCVPKDAQKAEQIFLKHIDNTNCVRVLAEMYRSGQGVPVDMEKALELKEVLVELEQEENIDKISEDEIDYATFLLDKGDEESYRKLFKVIQRCFSNEKFISNTGTKLYILIAAAINCVTNLPETLDTLYPYFEKLLQNPNNVKPRYLLPLYFFVLFCAANKNENEKIVKYTDDFVSYLKNRSDEEAYSYLSINQFYFFLSIYITSFGCNEQAFNELSKYAKMVIHNMNSSDGSHEHFMAMFYYLIHLEDQINSDPEYDCADELRFIYFKALELQDKEDVVSRITFFRAYYRIVATAKFNINIDIDASWLINAYDQITDVNEKNNWFEAATYAKHALFGESKFQEALDLEIKLMEVIKNDKDIDPVFLNNPDSRPGDNLYVFMLANLERYQEAKETVDNLINRDGLDIDTYLTYFKMGLSLYAGRQDKEGFLDYVADKSLDVNRFLDDPLFIGKFFGAALELCISGMPLETFKEFEESFEQFLFGHFEDNPYMLLRFVHAMFHTNNLLDVDNNELQLFINTRMLFSYCYYLNHGEKDWIDSNFIYAVNEAADLGFDAIEDGLDYKVFALLCFSAYYTLIQQHPDLLGEEENERFIQACRLRLRVETDPNKLKILADLIDQYE